MAAEPQKFIVGKPLKIRRVNPDGVRSVPVNDRLITHTKQEFYITFSSIEPPTILDEKDLEDLQGIDAVARAKLVVSLDFAEAIIKALSINIENYKNEIEPK